MKIAINAVPAAKEQKTGVEWYTYHLLRAMNALAPELEVTLYSHRPLTFALQGNWKNVVFARPWYGWKRKWSRVLASAQPDVVFVPAEGLPPRLPVSAKVVATIHDLAWRHVPEVFSVKDRAHLERVYADYAKRCDRLVSVSDVTKGEFANAYGVDASRVKTVWLGLENQDGRWRPRTQDDPEVIAVRKKYGIEGPYVFTIGRLEKKKGLRKFLEGFLQHRTTIGPRGTRNEAARTAAGALKVVMAGGPGTQGYEEIHAIAEREPDVLELGYVDEDDLPALLAGATLFVYPSYYEGFGLVMLQAWASGVPVLCSELPIFNEIGNGHDENGQIWLWNMKDATVAGWAQAMAYFFGEEDEMLPAVKKAQQRRINAALEHVKQFTWERAAKETLEVLLSERAE